MQDTEQNLLLLFSPEELRCKQYERFMQTDLGQLHSTIPFQALASCFPNQAGKRGVKGRFDIAGGIALQILKSYYNDMSAAKLIELINTDWVLQVFCGIRLGAGEQIKDADVVYRWRSFLGQYLDVDRLQEEFIAAWGGHIEQPESNVSDATCYESHVRYPTDVKLLWEGVNWLHQAMCRLCAYSKQAHPRNKYRDQKRKYLGYSRRRRKTYKQTRAVKKRLLYLLNKLMQQLGPLIAACKLVDELSRQVNRKQTKSDNLLKSPLTTRFFERLHTIKQVYRQQDQHSKRPDTKIKDRIVSLAKPYLRPIVRGKENKRVEFGIKFHKMMVGGIGFVEHWDFSAFHEGVRTPKTIRKHQKYFGNCKHFSGDALYATNKNRRFCRQKGIFTAFKPKGKPPKDQDLKQQAQILRTALNKERSTRLEGSFGNDKNHYGLRKVRARTEQTEKAQIFFAIFTANAVKIKKKINAPPQAA